MSQNKEALIAKARELAAELRKESEGDTSACEKWYYQIAEVLEQLADKVA